MEGICALYSARYPCLRGGGVGGLCSTPGVQCCGCQKGCGGDCVAHNLPNAVCVCVCRGGLFHKGGWGTVTPAVQCCGGEGITAHGVLCTSLHPYTPTALARAQQFPLRPSREQGPNDNPLTPPPQGAVTRVVCPPGPPVYEDSCTAARTSGPGGPRGREALGAPRGPSNRPPRHRGRQVQPRAAPPVPVQSGSADRPQSCVELGHPLPSAVVGDQRHVGRPGGGVSRPTTPPVGSVSGSPSLPTGAWSTRRHTSPHTQARRHLPPACATAGYGGGHQSGRP